jgi:hypothetical protein
MKKGLLQKFSEKSFAAGVEGQEPGARLRRKPNS